MVPAFWGLCAAPALGQLGDDPEIMSCSTPAGEGIFAPPMDSSACNNDVTAPCFADVKDILTGQRSLLRTDDVIVSKDDGSGSAIFETSGLTLEDPITISPSRECGPLFESEVGRIFSLPNDVIANFTAAGSCESGTLTVLDPQDSRNESQTEIGSTGTFTTTTMADFDLDGYQDIFVLGDSQAQVWTAKCTNDPFASCTGTAGNAVSDGMVGGPVLTLAASTDPVDYPQRLAAGDFNGDGAVDVAWVASGQTARAVFASVCPAKDAKVLGNTCGAALEIIQVPATSDIDTGLDPTVTEYFLEAGNFDGAVDAKTGSVDAELMLVTSPANIDTVGNLVVNAYDFDSSFKPTMSDSSLSFTTFTEFGSGSLTRVVRNTTGSGRLDWGGIQDQLVVAVFSGLSIPSLVPEWTLSVITADADLTLTEHNLVTKDTSYALPFLAIGRFDPPNLSGGATDFNQQIIVAVFPSLPYKGNEQLRVYEIPDPSTSLVPRLASTRSESIPGLIRAGDSQGRSLVLGEPDIATVFHKAPDAIVGLVPMHVDYIANPENNNERGVLNVTVFPNQYNAAYNLEQMSQSAGQRLSATSYTASTKESAEQKVSYGIPDVASVSATFKESATQTHQATTCKVYNSYESQSFNIGATTVFDDLVTYTSRTHNIYSYPVIGQKVCPAGSPNCPDDCGSGPSPCPKQPLFVQFSGPDNLKHYAPTTGSALEWFQPVSEAGQVFSLPANPTQLKSDTPAQTTGGTSRLDGQAEEGFTALSQGGTSEVEWSGEGGDNVSSGTVSNHSFDGSVTLSGKAQFEVVGGEESASFDYSASKSVSTLNSSATSIAASKGVTVSTGNSGGSATSNLFRYDSEAFIFGLAPPEGTIQTDLTLGKTEVQSGGYLRLAYTNDPLAGLGSNIGGFWEQEYGPSDTEPRVDIALNHPQRWTQKEEGPNNPQQIRFNCPVGFTSTMTKPECMLAGGEITPLTYSDAPFYQMKGLFVRPAGETSGPTITSATLGDEVSLQLRVYNYSLTEMQAGSSVKAQLYAQPWVGAQFATGSATGGFAEAALVGEVTLEPIPPYCGGVMGTADPCPDAGEAERNLVLADFTWKTQDISPAPTEDSDWVFWAVVWIEQGGELVPELAEHGLAVKPGQVTSLADIEVETYSNNLGFFGQVFNLRLPEQEEAPVVGSPDEVILTLEDFEVFPPVPVKDQPAVLRVAHATNQVKVDAVISELFLVPDGYDEGDPEAQGSLKDINFLPRIPDDGPHTTALRFLPRRCGLHSLVVVANAFDGSGANALGSLDIDVTVDPVDATQSLIDFISGQDLRRSVKRPLKAKLRAARRFFERGKERLGERRLDAFIHKVLRKSGKKIPVELAANLVEGAEDIKYCLFFAWPDPMKVVHGD